jgi:hypothetical protein
MHFIYSVIRSNKDSYSRCRFYRLTKKMWKKRVYYFSAAVRRIQTGLALWAASQPLNPLYTSNQLVSLKRETMPMETKWNTWFVRLLSEIHRTVLSSSTAFGGRKERTPHIALHARPDHTAREIPIQIYNVNPFNPCVSWPIRPRAVTVDDVSVHRIRFGSSECIIYIVRQYSLELPVSRSRDLFGFRLTNTHDRELSNELGN